MHYQTQKSERDAQSPVGGSPSPSGIREAHLRSSRCPPSRRKELRRQADRLRQRATDEPEGFQLPPAGMITIADAIDALVLAGDEDSAAKLVLVGRLARSFRAANMVHL